MRGASDGVGRAYERRGNWAKNMAESLVSAYKNLIGGKTSIYRGNRPLEHYFCTPQKWAAAGITQFQEVPNGNS